MIRKGILLFLLFVPVLVWSQGALTGNIYEYSNRSSALEGALVRNLTTKSVAISDKVGRYSISAKVGDLITFGLAGFKTDTVYLINLYPKNIYLPADVNVLNTVNITGVKLSPYLDLKDAEATPARPVDYSKERGGLRLNLGYGKYRRQQAKVQELEEYDTYNEEILRNFSEAYIKKLLKLDGEDLKSFMRLYRPTVNLIKTERPFNYELYIAQSYSSWSKLPPEQRKKSSLLKTKDNP
ncbi:MAG: hypothetical protein EOO90_11700 [Pedobacter sp.]|nr:MAG: hypothetical protein EOO90_11700 [Pedobacter sp.]